MQVRVDMPLEGPKTGLVILTRKIDMPTLPRLGEAFLFNIPNSPVFNVDYVEWFITVKDHAVLPVIKLRRRTVSADVEAALREHGWRSLRNDETIPRG